MLYCYVEGTDLVANELDAASRSFEAFAHDWPGFLHQANQEARPATPMPHPIQKGASIPKMSAIESQKIRPIAHPTMANTIAYIMHAAMNSMIISASFGICSLRWSRLSEQNFRVDRWSVCRG